MIAHQTQNLYLLYKPDCQNNNTFLAKEVSLQPISPEGIGLL